MDKFSFTSKFSLSLCGVAISIGTSACLARGTDFAQIYDLPGTFTQVDFATLESQVLGPKCLSCHSDFDTAQGISPYVTPGDPAHSSLYTEISGGDMPPGGPTLPTASQTIVEEYINGLSQATLTPTIPVTSVSPIPEPSSVSYTMLYQSVLQAKCLMCHQDFGTEAGLQKYIVPGDPEKSSLYEESASGSMPPGGPALPADELSMMKTYISGVNWTP
jgi:hypothetical protein